MELVEQRAFTSMNRKVGQFTLLLDEGFDILWHSESLCSVLGYDDMVGHSSVELVHPDDLAIVLETMVQVNQHDDVYNQLDPDYSPEAAVIRVTDVNGVWRALECTTYNHLDDPEIRGVLCTCKLVHDRSDIARAVELLGTGADVETVLPVVARLADRSLGNSTRTSIAWRQGDRVLVTTAAGDDAIDQRLADAATLVWSLGLHDALVITDLDDPRLDGAGRVAAANGYRAAFLVPVTSPAGPDVIGAMVAWGRTSVDFQNAEQSPVHVALRLAALAIADSRTKRDLRWAASHDPLTGLVNRAEFARRLDATAATGDIVLLYIDLDDFKPINDQHGHSVGDTVLVEVGRRIGSSIGGGDVVGRLGGDEFAVVLAGTDDPIYGRSVADRICAAIRQPITAGGIGVRVGASVGVAVGAQPLIPAVLMQRADEALYHAKHSGKNTVCLAS